MWGLRPHAPAGSAPAAWPSRAHRTPDGVPAPSPPGGEGVPRPPGERAPRAHRSSEGERVSPRSGPEARSPPHPHPGGACAAARATRVLLWGLRPHAPAGSAHAAWPSRAHRTPDGVRLPRPEGEGGDEGVPPPPSRRSVRTVVVDARDTSQGRSGPPTRPRMFSLWGLRPHAPAGSAHARGLRGRTELPMASGSLAPRERVGMRAFRRPPGEKGRGRTEAPRASAFRRPPGERAPRAHRSSEGERVPPPAGREGAAHRSSEGERAPRAHRSSEGERVSICGGCAPTPPPDQQRPRSPEDGPAPSPRGRGLG